MHTARTPTASFFFYNDTATTEIYPLPLHDPLPISPDTTASRDEGFAVVDAAFRQRRKTLHAARSSRSASGAEPAQDRKSTRLNSSHSQISYAVFCLKKKKTAIYSNGQL